MTAKGLRRRFRRVSTRGRRDQLYICMRPRGVRVELPSPLLLRTLPRGARRHDRGRVVVVLSSERRYTVHGVRSGTSLRTARRRLHLGRGDRVGRNTWFTVRYGHGRALLRVTGAHVAEVGVLAPSLVRTRAHARSLLRSFR